MAATTTASFRRISSLVFCDVETTGLPQPNRPHRITELSLCAVERSQFLSAKLKEIPRVTNRLNICLNPSISIHPVAAKMTLLDNQVLEEQHPFDKNAFNVVNSFLCRLKPPVCLVAHNGNSFDFPLLRAEIDKLDTMLREDLLCTDSLPIFRGMFPNQKNDLGSVYYRFFQEKPPISHAAEADVVTLLLSTMSIAAEFLTHVEAQAIPFKDIKKCW